MSLVKGNGIKVVIVETVFTFLSVIAVILRIWARRITKKVLAINDWTAISACVRSFWFSQVSAIFADFGEVF